MEIGLSYRQSDDMVKFEPWKVSDYVCTSGTQSIRLVTRFPLHTR